MKLNGQHKQVYDYLKTHGRATIREIRDNTFPSVQKPCMRISEINRMYKDFTGDKEAEMIGNAGKNKSREVIKTIVQELPEKPLPVIPDTSGPRTTVALNY